MHKIQSFYGKNKNLVFPKNPYAIDIKNNDKAN